MVQLYSEYSYTNCNIAILVYSSTSAMVLATIIAATWYTVGSYLFRYRLYHGIVLVHVRVLRTCVQTRVVLCVRAGTYCNIVLEYYSTAARYDSSTYVHTARSYLHVPTRLLSSRQLSVRCAGADAGSVGADPALPSSSLEQCSQPMCLVESSS